MIDFNKLYEAELENYNKKLSAIAEIEEVIKDKKKLEDSLQDQQNKLELNLGKVCNKLRISYNYSKSLDQLQKEIKSKSFFQRRLKKEALKISNEFFSVKEQKKQIIEEISVMQKKLQKNQNENDNDSLLKDNNIVIKGDILERDSTLDQYTPLPDNDNLVLVHSTELFPENKTILCNSDSKREFKYQKDISNNCCVVKEYISNRHTVHFALNSKVRDTGDGKGQWKDPKFIIIEPYVGHEGEFVSAISNGDNYTDSSLKLSNKAILMVRDDVYPKLTEEQKEQYNIVIYSGDSNVCVSNLLKKLNIPIIYNNANDSGHSHSTYYGIEKTMDERDIQINLLFGNYSAYTNTLLNAEQVALIYNKILAMASSEHISYSDTSLLGAVKEFSNIVGIPTDLAKVIMTAGIIIENNSFRVLNYREIEEHLSDADYYINIYKNNREVLNDVLNYAQNYSIEDYVNRNEQTYDIENMTISNIQTINNFSVLKTLVDKMNLPNDKIAVLRYNGLYIATKKPDGDYKPENAEEICIASNENTLSEALNNYYSFIQSQQVVQSI